MDYYDTAMPGLILRVNYGGAKVFRALHYIKRLGKDGRRITTPTTTKLGRHPNLTVKEAREGSASSTLRSHRPMTAASSRWQRTFSGDTSSTRSCAASRKLSASSRNMFSPVGPQAVPRHQEERRCPPAG